MISSNPDQENTVAGKDTDYFINQEEDATFSIVTPDGHVFADRLESRADAEELFPHALEYEEEMQYNDDMVDTIAAMLDENPYANGRAQVLAWLLFSQADHFGGTSPGRCTVSTDPWSWTILTSRAQRFVKSQES
jgi:hypothetical protein